MNKLEQQAKAIQFYSEAIDFKLKNQKKITHWINQTILQEKGKLSFLNFIFCSDEYLYKINMEYLNHDTYTDVITFPYSDEIIEGDIFISIDRVNDNAKQQNVLFEHELLRVIIHGVLHLLGYKDKSSKEVALIRAKEDNYIKAFFCI